MQKLDEQALKLLLATKTVARIELRERDGGFGVFVRVANASQPLILMSSRKAPRSWASLDKFVKFLRAATSEQPPEILILWNAPQGGRARTK